MLSEIVSLVFPFFVLILVGYAAGRWLGVGEGSLAGLNVFVFYLAMPALFFQIIVTTPLAETSIWSYVLTTTFATYCAFAFAFSFGALINRGNIGEATIQGLIGSNANVGFMAPALVIAAFGSAAAVPIALIFSFDTAMLLALTPLMMALGGTMRIRPAALVEGIARQVFLHPFIIATILGFIAAGADVVVPAPIDTLLTLLRSAAAPAALFALGLTLGRRQVGRVSLETTVATFIKLIVHPAIVYLLLGWVGGFDSLWVQTAVLAAALPPATNVLILARRYNTFVEDASTAMVLATAVSVATVTIALILLLNDSLPDNPFG